jgi:arsenate reductase (thioredoxin)
MKENSMTDTEIVLFVCLHASAKSLIAMECFNHLAAAHGSQLRAISAGTEPDDAIPPEVVAGLTGDGFDVSGRTPLRLTPAFVAHAAAIVSFGPDIAAVAPARVPVRHWNDMPAVSDDYAIARDSIHARVATFFAEMTAKPAAAM